MKRYFKTNSKYIGTMLYIFDYNKQTKTQIQVYKTHNFTFKLSETDLATMNKTMDKWVYYSNLREEDEITKEEAENLLMMRELRK